MSALSSTVVALLISIRAVESSNGLDPAAYGNEYQITQMCVTDVNRVYGTRYVWPRDVRNRERAEDIARLYLVYYGQQYVKEYGVLPSKATLARIYHRGYRGMKRGEGKEYADKVLREYKKRRRR